METFYPGKLEKHHPHPYHHHHPVLHHHLPPVEFLPGGGGGSRYGGAKSHPGGAPGNAFNSWNDYLGLATLITKAVGQEQGFRTGPSSVVVAATVQQVQAAEEGDEEEEEEEDDDDEEEEEDDEEEGSPYFENSLDLRDFALCGHHHHHHHHHHHLLSSGESLLEERFADFSPFSGRSSPGSVVFNCSPEHLERDRSPHAWGGRLVVDSRLQAAPRGVAGGGGGGGARLLKPELQVCVFCRNNKEAVALYTTHILKGPDGRVLCPVLRRYTCPLCGASGDNAHTIKYCPLSKMHGGGGPKQPLKSARHILGKKLR